MASGFSSSAGRLFGPGSASFFAEIVRQGGAAVVIRLYAQSLATQ